MIYLMMKRSIYVSVMIRKHRLMCFFLKLIYNDSPKIFDWVYMEPSRELWEDIHPPLSHLLFRELLLCIGLLSYCWNRKFSLTIWRVEVLLKNISLFRLINILLYPSNSNIIFILKFGRSTSKIWELNIFYRI